MNSDVFNKFFIFWAIILLLLFENELLDTPELLGSSLFFLFLLLDVNDSKSKKFQENKSFLESFELFSDCGISFFFETLCSFDLTKFFSFKNMFMI